MESYSGTSGDLEEDGQQAFETRGLRDLDLVDQGGNEVVGIFECVTDEVQTLYEEAGTLVDVVRGAIQFAVDCFVFWHIADEFIIHRSRAFFINVINTEECTSEGGCFSEGYKERFMDLALGVDEDSAEEEDEAAYTQNGCGDEL